MSKNKFIIQTGITTDGKPVVSGLFKMFETEGIPLDTLLCYCMDHELVPNWIDLYNECLDAGMKHDRIISKLAEAISDSFGKEWMDVVIFRLNNMFKSQEKS